MEYRTIRPAQFTSRMGAEPAEEVGEVILDEVETRVLGSLVEKEATTPDYYPLTLNSLTSACNQKSSRDPVVSYSSDEVGAALTRLREKSLATEIRSRDGGRVAHYRHLFLERLQLNRREAAVLCILMLRGPQTVGEIRGRSARLFEFASLVEVEESLAVLAAEEPRPHVVKMPRVPGTKESRYAHQLSGEVATDIPAVTQPAATSTMRETAAEQPIAGRDRVGELEQEVGDLKERLAEVERQLEEFRRVFE